MSADPAPAPLPFLDAPSYKWIFVGGKGGVGKTTTACAIAVALTKCRGRVLLVSTDPASNLGDTFQQHFTSEPTMVNGFENLWAVNGPSEDGEDDEGERHGLSSLMKMPGVDELQILSSLFSSVEHDEYDVVVFDTAPTGHTMRLLQLPSNCMKLFGGTGGMTSVVVNSIAQFAGSGSEEVGRNLTKMQGMVRRAAARLTNSLECTFVCVTLPKFAPMWETERLINFLTEQGIESHTLVVNQMMDEVEEGGCPVCFRRWQAQKKQMDEIYHAYDDFRILKVPDLDEEVKGVDDVRRFSELVAPLFSGDNHSERAKNEKRSG